MYKRLPKIAPSHEEDRMKIIDDFAQGDPLWFEARLGSVGASSFSKIITSTGKPSDSAKKLLYRLAGEAVSGISEETYSNHHMERGIAMEDEARKFYELVTDNTVHQIALCKSDIPHVHVSPDGIMPDIKRGLEIKCPSMPVHVEYLIKNNLPTKYKAQVQGSMFVLGYDTYDFISYYPSIKPLIITVERNEEFIARLKEELERFVYDLDRLVKKIKEMQ